MKAMIVYDSIFGNTERIALALGTSLGSGDSVRVCRVQEVTPAHLAGIDLLVVGSPTRAFKPTKAIRTFLNSIPANGLAGVGVAAFDTRVSTADTNSGVLNAMVKLFGYAAEPMAKKLGGKGGILKGQPRGFFVKGSEGPLKDGELERAAEWVKSLL